MRDKKDYRGIQMGNVSGQVAIGEHITQTMTQTANETVNYIMKVREAIEEIDEEELPEKQKNRALKKLDSAIEEAKAKEPDKEYIAEDIMSAVEEVRKAKGNGKDSGLMDGVNKAKELIKETSALGAALIPLAKALGFSAGYFLG